MLERGGSPDLEFAEVFEALWNCLGCRVQLPEPAETYFAETGIVSKAFIERRRFPRFHYRYRAILIADAECHAVYTKNISRAGLSFYHAKPVPPCSTGELILGNGASLNVTIRRCRRISDRCYDCGANIERADRNTAEATLNRVMTGTALTPTARKESATDQVDPASPSQSLSSSPAPPQAIR